MILSLQISQSDSESDDVNELNTGRIFNCNYVGCIKVSINPKVSKKELDEAMWSLLAKHCTFVIKKRINDWKEPLSISEVKPGYWRFSNEFFEGLTMFFQEIEAII